MGGIVHSDRDPLGGFFWFQPVRHSCLSAIGQPRLPCNVTVYVIGQHEIAGLQMLQMHSREIFKCQTVYRSLVIDKRQSTMVSPSIFYDVFSSY